MYQFSYMLGNIGLFIPWLILFVIRKDTRKEMLIMSFLFGCGGIMVQPIFMVDWWRPLTITNTILGLEDFLFGFMVGGITAVIYEIVMRKKLIPDRKHVKVNLGRFSAFFLLASVLFYGSFFLFHIHSFWASLIAVMGTTICIWILRKDLIVNSILSGFLFVLVSFPFFVLPEFISPGWVENYWYMENLTGITILNGPIEDYIWGLTTGFLVGPLYEFWQGSRISSNRKR